MPAIRIDVHYGFICPWCWIGQRNPAAALAEAGIERTAEVAFRYLPFELNPDMPPKAWIAARIAARSSAVGRARRSGTRR
ncbi:DsbA family protein [Caballeronia catudaia]|uniref:DsbA family protein n=1 Tax=Caballeronia catudaia TaxID=1777136 RepID=UPI0022865AFB|nr:DsbA family protein [Caballeronia catudaia]